MYFLASSCDEEYGDYSFHFVTTAMICVKAQAAHVSMSLNTSV